MKEKLIQLIRRHLQQLQIESASDILVEEPKFKDHGDFSTNIAMSLAKALRSRPFDIAQKLVDSLRSENIFEKVEVKGAGFINFFLKPEAFHAALQELWSDSQHLVKLDFGKGQRILVEFVSANPTGPMHVGHGRNAVVGDCVARLLEALGYQVSREFYVNDHGVQIQTLGHSGLHYHTVLTSIDGVKAALPDDVYRGAYLEELVLKLQDQIAPIRDKPLEIGKLLGMELLEEVKKELQRLDIIFDRYYSESSLYETGKIDEALAALKQKGWAYEKEGALWFKTTDFGDDKDRVLIKNDGTYTYFTPDIAYHKDKFERSYDVYLNVMGADHGGYVQRLKAAVSALGYDSEKLQFLLMQLVNLKRRGEVVNMSKRSGEYVTLHEVIDEVGKDATRFFFMMRSHHSTLDFDLELAKEKTAENPVYYIQYAHARMCSIFRKAIEAGYESPEKLHQVDLSPLLLEEEMDLVKILLNYPEVLKSAVEEREPHRLAFYLQDLAKVFQNYYTRGKSDERYKVISNDRPTTIAKLYLLKTLRQVFRSILDILGVSAPERMDRDSEAL